MYVYSLNALSLNQRWEMFLLLEHMKRDDDVRVVIWTGTGRSFNSGADLRFDTTCFVPEHVQEQYLAREMGPMPADFVLTYDTLAFWDFPKPSICAVNGLAVGGAANIALMNYHDLVICSTKARFMYPFPKLGFTPELGSSLMMPALVGTARAKEIFYLCDWFSAEKAKEIGLVNKVVAPEELLPEAMKIAEKLVLMPPDALRLSKKVINSQFRKVLRQTLDYERENFDECREKTGGPLQTGPWIKERTEWLKGVKSKL